jgi:hypothetical protein
MTDFERPKLDGFVDTGALLADTSLPHAHSLNVTTLPLRVSFDKQGDMLLTRGASGLKVGSAELEELVKQIAERP